MIEGRQASGVAQPLVSVIVLNYNGARWLERCLNSLRAQTFFDRTEVIVADNVSSDGSERIGQRIVEGWPGGHFIQHGQNLGYCEGNNRAAEAARGEYLLFLNNDTWLEPNCLERAAGRGAKHRRRALQARWC